MAKRFCLGCGKEADYACNCDYGAGGMTVTDEMAANLNYWRDKLEKCKAQRDKLELQIDELKAEVKKLHDGHGYKSGLGSCVCKWCAEKRVVPVPKVVRHCKVTDNCADSDLCKCTCFDCRAVVDF